MLNQCRKGCGRPVTTKGDICPACKETERKIRERILSVPTPKPRQ